jgi:hypothetical protein
MSSFGKAARRGGDWRYLLVFLVGVMLPSALLFLPVKSFLGGLFDTSPRAEALLRTLDSSAFLEVLKQSGEPGTEGIGVGFQAALLVAALLAPVLAGAVVHLARTSETTGFRSLLGAAGELYPRMLRMAVVSVLPLGIAGGLIAAVMHFTSDATAKSVLESSADHLSLASKAVAVLLVWLANVTVDAGRAHFAAQPERKSAFLAWWSGVKLTARHPLDVLGLCLGTTLLGVGLAAFVTAIRLRVPQSGAGSIALGFLLAQLAVLPLAWGRATRVVGMADRIRDDVR